MYALKARFVSNWDDVDVKCTYYPEVQFKTMSEALEALIGDYGDSLAQSATIDSENEDDLVGYYFDDIEAYQIGDE